ncbi:MAG TPA: 4Fe-4S binding protein [Candidatus Cloacimonadota bacterium]|nr:4Fe-4S binding protein [Candidatus Cloacimonadota bacterium]
MNLNLAESEYVQSENCIHCGLCAEVCPKPGTYSEESE